MALDLETKYPGRTTGASADYPFGSFKNESTEGAEDGTPVEKDWANDREGAKQKRLSAANLIPNNEVDTVQKCQDFSAQQLLTANGTRIAQATPEDLCSGMPGMEWHNPTASPNFVNVGYLVLDSCLAWDLDVERPRILVIDEWDSIKPITGMWEYNSSPSVGGAITFNFPSTPDYIVSICSDKYYIYLAWIRDSDDNLMISKYVAHPFTANPVWTRDTELSFTSANDRDYIKLIVANASYLAVSLPTWADPITGPAVGILNKVSGSLVIGRGSMTGYSINDGTAKYGKIVSDGVHVFWMSSNQLSTASIFLESAKILSPTTSDYLSQTIASDLDEVDDQAKYFRGLLNVGGTNGTVAFLNQAGEINIFSKADDDHGGCVKLWSFYDYYDTPEYDVMLGSDGLNAWMFLYKHFPQTSGARLELYKIPLSALGRGMLLDSPVIQRDIYPLPQSVEYSEVQGDYKAGQMIFDGRDMWLVHKSGGVHRVANPGLR